MLNKIALYLRLSLYILSGAGILKTGEQETRLREGMSVWFPANVEHSVSNPHKGSLRILFATAFI
jgi:mannose-6-phosphate isomerase-like protein (cupin superfamily)